MITDKCFFVFVKINVLSFGSLLAEKLSIQDYLQEDICLENLANLCTEFDPHYYSELD